MSAPGNLQRMKQQDEIAAAGRFLRSTGWLAATPASFANNLLARCVLLSVERGYRAYRIGQQPDGLRGIVSGGFAFEIAPHERGPHLAHVFRPGSWFGELEQFAGIPTVSSITATRPSVFLHINQSSLMDLLVAEPEAWRWIGLLCGQHLMIALGVVDDASIRDPAQRIAALLLRLADVRDGDNAHDPTPQLDITQEDLAHLATVSRTTVATHLADLERLGLIARTYGRLTLLNPTKLRNWVSTRA